MKTTNSKNVFVRLFLFIKDYKYLYLLALFLMLIMVFLDMMTPLVTKEILAYLEEDVVIFSRVLYYVLILSIAIIAFSIIRYIQTILLSITGNKVVYKIRNDTLEHIQKLSHNQFNDLPIGKLVTRVTSDVNVLYSLYTGILINLIQNILTIVVTIIIMFFLSVKLTLILLAIFPVIVAISFIYQYFSRKVHRKVRDNVSSMNAFLSENISGIKLTQVFNQEAKKYNEFLDNNKNLRKSYLKEIITFGIFRPTIYILYIICVILVFWFGGKDAMEGAKLDYAALFTFYMLISKFFNPIQAFADQFNELQSALASAEKIFTVLDTVPEIVDSEDAIDLEIKGDIEFKDVWFSYIPGEWILKGVSFHIHKDDTIAFVGATGSGKTTILSLIVRNYDIQKGQILIEGVDIKKIKLSSLRSQIGQMLQDVFLFSGSIKTNITMNDEFTDHEVVDVSNYVNASKFIEKLPNSYNEETKERGNNFSSGQRQLISFARTIIHKPSVLILDEATSNIDTETEILIQDSLSKMMKHQTVLVVAHRLSTIQHATKIYVFSSGNIIESGNHQELLALKGNYYKLYRLQFERN